MIILNAQQLQRLSEALLRLERMLEAEGADPGALREGLEEAAHRMGVHLAVVRLADAGTLLRLHGPASGGDPAKLWATAEILFLDGIRARAEGELSEARQRIRTALALFGEVDPGLKLPEASPPLGERMDQAQMLLDGEAR